MDACVAQGIVDPARLVVEGWSWGGYLALLAAGTQPSRWAGASAGVPVADYLAAYADEMEQLRAFDRALFGGSPEQRPEVYRASSPLTYVDEVTAPVLVLAGENDPRCPIRQIDNYLEALAARKAAYEVSRFDAGHGSLVVDEAMRHAATEVAFARRSVDADVTPSGTARDSQHGPQTCASCCVSESVTHDDDDGVVPEEVASWRCGAFTWSWRTDRAGSVSWPLPSVPPGATSSRCTSWVSRRTAARSPTSCWSGSPRASTRRF